VSGKVLKDPVNYGLIDVTRVITKSSQVGIAKIALAMGDVEVRNMMERFGLGLLTESGFPGEASGSLPNHRRWNAIQRVTLAFGHGLAITPLQLAQAYMVFANHGIKKPVTLLRQSEPVQGVRVLQPDVARDMLAMLETVTNQGGTGTRARVPGYRVGGKTGTAHKVGAGGYEKNRYRALFAGLAPISNPRIVTVVVVDDPQGLYKGGQVAAPIFSHVAGAALRLMNVPPDAIEAAPQVVTAPPRNGQALAQSGARQP
jgi:cell division protein FtsI (penicillin-binding protein 3)